MIVQEKIANKNIIVTIMIVNVILTQVAQHEAKCKKIKEEGLFSFICTYMFSLPPTLRLR